MRGTVFIPTKTVPGTPRPSQNWRLDAQRNWLTYTTDSTTQTRTHNAQNQITTLTQSGLSNPAYDANGNTTQDEFGDQFKYDAWNRLVHVTAAGNSYTYSYDALSRRITSQVNTGSVTDLYYSSAWQVVEEQVGAAMTAQYVWSPVYVDAMIERDTAGGSRLYVQQDAGWDVTAVVYTSGAVQERYAYNPYGKAGFLDPGTWQVHGGGSYGQGSVGWAHLYKGGRYERYSDAAGMYLFRNRDYSPTLGRWLQQDPAGYVGGTNLYRFVSDDPTMEMDPSGLAPQGLGLFDRSILPDWLNRAADTTFGVAQGGVEAILLAGEVGGQYVALGIHDLTGLPIREVHVSLTGEKIAQGQTFGAMAANAAEAFEERATEMVMYYLGGKVIQYGGKVIKYGVSRCFRAAPRWPATAPSGGGTIRPISGGSPMGMGNIGSHAPVNPTTALSGAQRWLGSEYRKIAPGVYRSADGLRQFRMTTSDLLLTHGNIGPHVHFEALDTAGNVIENLHLPITP